MNEGMNATDASSVTMLEGFFCFIGRKGEFGIKLGINLEDSQYYNLHV